MTRIRRRKPPFPVLYAKEYENYLEDMAKEGWRFVGNNRFQEDEGRPTTYRLMLGPRDLDDTLLTELQAKGWSYAGPFFRTRLDKDCWHVFATEKPEAPDSYFRQSLGATLESRRDTI